MEEEADPAITFFGEDEVDLYGTLGVEKTATAEDLRKAYRRLALTSHPDKHTSAPPAEQEVIKAHFLRIGFAYTILSDESRRARFDRTRRTDESAFEGKDAADWNDYFRELWSGEVSATTIDDFFAKYEGEQWPHFVFALECTRCSQMNRFR